MRMALLMCCIGMSRYLTTLSFEPYPLDAVYLRKLAAQAGKTALAVDIRAVAGDVLRDDDKLLDPVLRKLRRLVDDVLDRA